LLKDYLMTNTCEIEQKISKYKHICNSPVTPP
jgi:hypothetical protein